MKCFEPGFPAGSWVLVRTRSSPCPVLLPPQGGAEWEAVLHLASVGAAHFPCFWPLLPLSEKAMAPHSSTLAWKIPWMEEPGRLQSMGSLRVGHD